METLQKTKTNNQQHNVLTEIQKDEQHEPH